jgi:hypothetical protein
MGREKDDDCKNECNRKGLFTFLIFVNIAKIVPGIFGGNILLLEVSRMLAKH